MYAVKIAGFVLALEAEATKARALAKDLATNFYKVSVARVDDSTTVDHTRPEFVDSVSACYHGKADVAHKLVGV